MRRKIIFLIIICLTIFIILIIAKYKNSQTYNRNETINITGDSRNIIEDSGIKWSKGWEKLMKGSNLQKEVIYQGKISGSEINFKFTNTGKIIFHLESANKDPIIGLEVWLDGKHSEFAYPELKAEQTTIEFNEQEKKAIHELRGRFYCFIIPTTPCDFRIKSIEVDKNTKVLSSGENKKKTLGILGDSISGFWGNKNYSFLLADKINYYLINDSLGGSTMSDEGFLGGVSRIKESIIAYRPDLLIILLGTNDLGRNIKPESFLYDYERAINTLRKELTKTNIILLGILPRADYSQEKISAYSAVIESIASKYNLYYVDTISWLKVQDLTDGIHPTVEAQAKLTELIYNYLKENKLLYD